MGPLSSSLYLWVHQLYVGTSDVKSLLHLLLYCQQIVLQIWLKGSWHLSHTPLMLVTNSTETAV